MSKFLFKVGYDMVKGFDFTGCSQAEVHTRLTDLIDGMRFFLPIGGIHPDFNDLWTISGWLLEDDPDPCGFKLGYMDVVIVPIDDEYAEIEKSQIRIQNKGVTQYCTNICGDLDELPFDDSCDSADPALEYWFQDC